MVVELLSKKLMLATIATLASTPLERIQLDKEIKGDSTHLQTRLQRLSTLVGASEETMTRWLDKHHLEPAQLAPMLSSPDVDEDMLLPDWIETLDHILAETGSDSQDKDCSFIRDRSLLAEEPLPFEELLLPFVRYARQSFARLTQGFSELLSYAAHRALEHWLLERLFQQASRALQVEFSLFRAQHGLQKAEWQRHTTRRDLYEAFVKQYSGESMLLFLQHYSVLARLLVLLSEQWVKICQEFLQHLAADRQDLALLFNAGQEIGSVTEIIPGCSDNHHDGRTVFSVTFSSGIRLVYKPRSLDVDCAFFDLLSWMNTKTSGRMLDLHVISMLNRKTYGWVKYVDHIPCQTQEEVHRYYQRAGMLTCLLYMLGSTDIHSENLIAYREHPVVIDIETIITPSSIISTSHEAGDLSEQVDGSDFSILRTGLLPGSMLTGRGADIADMSSLGTITKQEVPLHALHWRHINTDAMSSREEIRPPEVKANVVILNGTIERPGDYAEEVITGFRTIYRFLLEHRQDLLAEQGPIMRFADCPIRFIFRGTYLYGKMLKRLTHPKLLRDGADRWLELQVFQKPLLQKNASSTQWAFIEAEQHSLARLDVPFFITKTDIRDIIPDIGPRIKDVLVASPLDLVCSHIAHLSEEDMERQIDSIRATFLCTLSLDEAMQEVELIDTREEENKNASTVKELVDVTRDIAREISTRAFYRSDGAISWMGFRYNEALDRYLYMPISTSLYEGTLGIALFLSIFTQITGENDYRDIVGAILQPLCYDLQERPYPQITYALNTMSIGGVNGLGAWVYTLARLGQWGQKSGWLDAARRVALLITSQRVSTDKYFDVVEGSAGAILGLLALLETLDDPQVLENAIACGRHLLKQRVATASGARSWLYLQQKPLTGFSHGAAGIAYALLRLYEVTRIQEFKDSAIEAIAYEQHVFSSEARNWPDLRKTETSTLFTTSWCHGAPGIGLARIGGLHLLNTPAVSNDIAVALETTLEYGLPWLDNLCCGNSGRLELLVAASQQLQRPDLLKKARQQASTLIHRAEQHGSFHVLSRLPRRVYNPALFEGTAGIGYELLRLAYPERVPSLLLWK